MRIILRAQVSTRWRFLAQPVGGYPLLSNSEADLRTWLMGQGIDPEPVLEQVKAKGEVEVHLATSG